MRLWLAIVAVLTLAGASAAHAQMKGLAPGEVAEVARTRAIDLRLSQELGAQRPMPLLQGMIVQHDFAPNASLGLGLANIYAKKKAGSDLRVGERPARSKRPAVSFVFKF
jgi:hypothetical protein